MHNSQSTYLIPIARLSFVVVRSIRLRATRLVGDNPNSNQLSNIPSSHPNVVDVVVGRVVEIVVIPDCCHVFLLYK